MTLPARRKVSAPPEPGSLDPLVHEWGPEQPIIRCHDSRFGATEFNRTRSEGRFRPVLVRGRIIGTLYGAEDDAGAVAEHVFRPVPVGAPIRRVRRARLVPVMISTLGCKRTLRLASLHGDGLRRVKSTRGELIDSESDQYPALAQWGQALHDCPSKPDGIVWRSRHYDDAYVLMLFGDRVRRADLKLLQPPVPLAVGRGLERVMELAERADITIVE
ncbi:MAG TPA: RES family NAD+ phosphorylase [Solirubrobacteraceae bacterium]|nr:RES family NAD+ phosphorylase [Solirubrobacteraceae bacterium]